MGQKSALKGAEVEKYSFKNRYPAVCLASCPEFGDFTLTIACAFAKTLSEANNIYRNKTGFPRLFCV
ncbi:hypothetical protein F3I27_19095 [Pantoea sp. Bo_2]|uniref:Uncharacterized protein n=1 Tax=Candidatus Pantoea gossypiicola TaxID=2608008 RepID=A0AB34CTE1_9GAMM|nr:MULTISPECIES: hypothetical protein [Pantoea]KAA5932059.1 hypothetical protein F3I59_03205 [Pantoea sp. VH_8]KAA5937120.1 hypothetical protein F3I58_03230 [Pantoea sp. VH_4]KAA5939764.1 hypothetical protein F3I57_18360 [Pantoea sp. VH_3]KAA5948477.1 hypothetical protein F3I56_19615 [Pantoea sp. VH_25]KAA5951720.1 hypothetical protein F3I55_19070 [Pantoea sp. VH_24]